MAERSPRALRGCLGAPRRGCSASEGNPAEPAAAARIYAEFRRQELVSVPPDQFKKFGNPCEDRLPLRATQSVVMLRYTGR